MEREPDDDVQRSRMETSVSTGESAGTATGGPTRKSRPAAPPEPPVPDWDRYRFEGYLGGGGMGHVFAAFDPQLDRRVALKFIRGEHPTLTERFLQEARAQAKVEHDHVCRVYEVGEVEGHRYIAMQFIDGVPLSEAHDVMTLEQKLLVMKEVAEALHAAHRTGLIHRDVKPSNIMIEVTDDAAFRPYVMDFGLAREQAGAGMTITGVPIGTPYYMPPEQALGQIHDLDRRSDVYGLGATMYSILAGHPPFQALSSTEVIRRVIEDVPESLTRVDATIPRDVDAITMKCLRKSRKERYDSARALAEDLGRYLDGEPVEARPTTVFYRLRIKAVKNRLAVGVAATGLVLLAISGAWGGYNRWTSARRARLARDFGQQVERIDALARYSHTVPLHDVRPERERIRDRMKLIESRMDQLGSLAYGPGSYALGRGYMATGSYADARPHLESAWKSGYDEPEVALALGRVMGALYKEALDEAALIPRKERREARTKEAEKTFLRPAVRYLREGRDADLESPDLVAAELAFYERRHDQALELSRAAFVRTPWTYEAALLEGDVHAVVAVEEWTRGDYDEALRSYELAAEAYAAAAAVGRSDPGVYVSLCALASSKMAMEMQGRARDVTPYFEEGLGACNLALKAHPGSPDAYYLLSVLQTRMGEYLRVQDQDPGDYYREAIELARGALESRPTAKAYGSLGTSHLGLGIFQQEHGEDPRVNLQEAAQAFRTSIELRPEYLAYNELGLVYKTLALYEKSTGEDPTANLDLAVSAYESSLAVNAEQIAANTNLGVAYYHKAGHQMTRGDDPRQNLSKSIEAYERAVAINPEQIAVLYNLGRAYGDLAFYEKLVGGDPRELLRRSAGFYRKAIEVDPESGFAHHFFNGMGGAYDTLARYQWEAGGDPAEALGSALAAYEQALQRNPKSFLAYGNIAFAQAFRAECAYFRGEDPGESVAAATRASREALALNPGHHFARNALGAAHNLLARYRVENGLDPGTSLREARAALEESIDANPADAYPMYELGRVMILQARRRMFENGDPRGAFEAARTMLEESIRLNDRDAHAHLALAELHRRRAEWRLEDPEDSRAEIRGGLTSVETALEIKPDLAEALAVRGELLLLEAEVEPAAVRKTVLARDAGEALGKALAMNGNLRNRYESSLTKAEAHASEASRT